jgi:hypothetical protein
MKDVKITLSSHNGNSSAHNEGQAK